MPPFCLAVYCADSLDTPLPSTITMAVNCCPPKPLVTNFRTRAQSRIRGLILELKDVHEALLHQCRQGTHVLRFPCRLLIYLRDTQGGDHYIGRRIRREARDCKRCVVQFWAGNWRRLMLNMQNAPRRVWHAIIPLRCPRSPEQAKSHCASQM